MIIWSCLHLSNVYSVQELMHGVIELAPQAMREEELFSPILQMSKLRPREVTSLSLGHPAGKLHSGDMNPFLLLESKSGGGVWAPG